MLSKEKMNKAQVVDDRLISLFDDEEFRRIDHEIERHQSEVNKKRFLLDSGVRLDRWTNRIIAFSIGRNVRAIRALELERRGRIMTLVNNLMETELKDIFKKNMKRHTIPELHQSLE